MCEVIGYKDVEVKCVGSHTYLSMVNCFLRVLQETQTEQERADRLRYNLVELDPQRGCRPTLVAQPRTPIREEPYPMDKAYFHRTINFMQFNAANSGLYRK